MMKRTAAIFLALWAGGSLALDLELTQGVNALLPIGIHSFQGDTEGQVTSVIDSDFRMSGQFKLISSPTMSRTPSLSLWRQAGADDVLSGEVQPLGGQRYRVAFQLVDAAANGRVLLAKEYQVDARQLRSLAHHISDEVYQKLTGDRGVFSTRIAYILVKRNGDNAHYSLEVADVDGSQPQSLITSSEPLMSPTWAPNGREIAYVSFEKKRAQIYSVSVETGHRRLLTDFTGINGAPAWSPNAAEMAVVLSKTGSPKVYRVDMSSGQLTQLTFGDAIDTEPRFSPDGRAILFTSGRGGSPQIYRLSLADGKISRLTYEGNYNERASLTPDQKFMVMLHREDSQFNIAVQDMSNGTVTPVTFSSFDESPSLAPNGRLIVYATRERDQGILALVSIDGRAKTRLPARSGDIQEPAWSPYLG